MSNKNFPGRPCRWCGDTFYPRRGHSGPDAVVCFQCLRCAAKSNKALNEYRWGKYRIDKVPRHAIRISKSVAGRGRYLRLCAFDASYVRKVGKKGEPVAAALVGVGLDVFVGLDAVILDTLTKALYDFSEDGPAFETVVSAQDLSVKIGN